MSTQQSGENTSLVKVIASAIQVPGVKVNRENFLLEVFKKESSNMRSKIIEVGPVKAGISRKKLKQLAMQTINTRTMVSSTASFVAGLPGGLAMAATIPADTLQFFGVALRLAQELSYLYGEDDLWIDGALDMEKVTSQLVVYCGVMFGAAGASATVRVLSSTLGKQALKKIPQMALTKTFYYPIVKAIAKAVGVKMTKGLFAKGVSKAVPILGGIVSGGITFISMRPMGMRLADEFDEICFDYSRQEFQEDWDELVDEFGVTPRDFESGAGSHNLGVPTSGKTIAEQIMDAKALLDSGVITAEEFAKIKENLIAKM